MRVKTWPVRQDEAIRLAQTLKRSGRRNGGAAAKLRRFPTTPVHIRRMRCTFLISPLTRILPIALVIRFPALHDQAGPLYQTQFVCS